MAQRLVNI